MTNRVFAAGAAVLIGVAVPSASAAVATETAGSMPACGAEVARPSLPPRAYVAIRRLEGRTERNRGHGWMDVRTTVEDGRFTYEVLDEGGSEQIRKRALYPVLQRERELAAKGTSMQMPALLADYDCAPPEAGDGGMMRMAIQPRHPGRHLVKGTLLWDPRSGTVLGIAGRLAKNPSFWVSDVQMNWEYASIDGAALPTAVHVRAQVRFVGPSTFDMTYRYLSVGRRPVQTVVAAATHSGRQ